ncbi:YjzC family protein [Bacillus mycoides]|uniref:YjzC family protein n=1 Tax=Bacillus mycoides TaxID=1405 RepID=UPI0011A366AD|nr:YjzC family protein [Bacillus mycoides]
MAQNPTFPSPQKTPNHPIYLHVPQTPTILKHPQILKLTARDRFPHNSNQNPHCTYKRKP